MAGCAFLGLSPDGPAIGASCVLASWEAFSGSRTSRRGIVRGRWSLSLGPGTSSVASLFLENSLSSWCDTSRSSRAMSGVTLFQCSSPGSLTLEKRDPWKSSNLMCRLVPTPSLALSLVPNLERSRKVSPSLLGISSLMLMPLLGVEELD